MKSPIENIIKNGRNFIVNSSYHDLNDKLKRMIRKRLWQHQNGICVYCQREIEKHTLTIIDEHIEHILPKSKYPQLALSAYNLALACSTCNYNKGQMDIIGTVQLQNKLQNICFNDLYDENFLKNINNTHYAIMHPYYDDYNSNIVIENFVYLIKPNAPNRNGAANMIKICKFDEITAIEQKKHKEASNRFYIELYNRQTNSSKNSIETIMKS